MKDYLNLITDIYHMMSSNNILLTYLGDVTPDITNSLLKAIKHDSRKYGEVQIKKKVYKIIVECLENIYRHTGEIDTKQHPAIFLIGKADDAYHIVTGNYINQEQKKSIQKALDNVNNLSKDEIKQKFRDVISSPMLSDNGAGLGMIDIALKSGNKMEYDFIKVDDQLLFYILKVKVEVFQHA